MVVRSIPASRSQKLKVPNTNKSGRPAENPSNSIRTEAGSRYTLKVVSQEGLFGVSSVALAVMRE